MKKYLPQLIIFLSLVLFSPSISNFFFSDDWFHLRISQISSLNEFGQFFSFTANDHTAAFYRPLTTQVFFFVLNKLFGLNVIFYHLVIAMFFAASLWLLYKFLLNLFKEKIALLGLFFYAFSVTNFSRHYFLSAFQEIGMVFFLLLTLMFFLKSGRRNYLLAILFFCLSLMSKETAVVLPAILVLINFYKKQLDFKKILPFIAISIIYVINYVIFFGLKSSDSYLWDFSPFKALNTLFWYSLWSLGGPELLVDYVGSGLKIVPKFFVEFPLWSKIILPIILVNIIVWGVLFLRNVSKVKDKFILGGLFYLAALSPVIFLPWHKFSLELTLPLIGFVIMLSALVTQEKRKSLKVLTLSLFIILNFATYLLTFQTNYVIGRAKLSATIYNYFSRNYPIYPRDNYFEITNFGESSVDWGQSKQIALASSYSDLFKVLYKNKSVEVFFADIPSQRPEDKTVIKINSLDLLAPKALQ